MTPDFPPGRRPGSGAGVPQQPGLLPADLILTGVQAIDDLDGLIAPLVADDLGMPYLGIITRIGLEASGQTAVALKEYPGGVHGEFEVRLPAVLGIQAAEKPPRYVPVAKVRAAMKAQKIDCAPAPTLADGGWPAQVVEMKRNEPAGHAEMLEGAPERCRRSCAGFWPSTACFEEATTMTGSICVLAEQWRGRISDITYESPGARQGSRR